MSSLGISHVMASCIAKATKEMKFHHVAFCRHKGMTEQQAEESYHKRCGEAAANVKRIEAAIAKYGRNAPSSLLQSNTETPPAPGTEAEVQDAKRLGAKHDGPVGKAEAP